jgi:hypothetical protein
MVWFNQIMANKIDGRVARALATKKLGVWRLGFEVTRKCNLKCAHCCRGDAQNLSYTSPDVPAAVFDQFPFAKYVHIFGGETQLAPSALFHFNEALQQSSIKFLEFGMVTNGTIYDKAVFDTIRQIAKRGKAVNIYVSNDEYHNDAIGGSVTEGADIPNDLVRENFEKIKTDFPEFNVLPTIYQTKAEMFPNLQPIGRASELTVPYSRKSGLVSLRNVPKDGFRVGYQDPVTGGCEGGNGKKRLRWFTTDVRGNIIEKNSSYQTMDKDNYGNVLRDDIAEIIMSNL